MPIRIHIHTNDADQWITVHPNQSGSGSHVLIGANGQVKAGMGGKFNGKKISSVTKKLNAPITPAQTTAGSSAKTNSIGVAEHAAPPAKTQAKSKPEKLSANERSALSSYSGDDFLRINKELREGNASDPSVARIDSAIDKSPLQTGTTLYRGMTKEAAKKLFPNGNITKGMTISDPAFSSTSKSAGVSHSWGMGGVMLKIETGANAKGIDMSPHSRNASEQEVLLPRNAKMKVVGLTPPKSPGDPVIVRVQYGE